MALDKSDAKVSSYGLPEHELWILKIVQAAVAQCCESVKVVLGRETVKVELRGGFSFDVSGVVDALRQEPTGNSTPLSDLYLGLRSLTASTRFLLRDSGGRQVIWDGNQFYQGEERVSDILPNLAIWVTRPMPESWLRSIKARARQTVRYQELLRTRALFAPLELKVDGRVLSYSTLDKTELVQTEDEEHRDSPVHLLDGRYSPGGHRLNFAESRPSEDASLSRTPFLSARTNLVKSRFQLQLFLSFKLQQALDTSVCITLPRPMQVHFGRRGVVCHSLISKVELSHCFGAAYQELSAEHGDISGLNILPNAKDWSKYQESMESMKPVLLSLAEKLPDHRPKSHQHQPSEEAKRESRRASATVYMVGLPPVLLLGAKMIPIGLGLLALSAGLRSLAPAFFWTNLPEGVMTCWSVRVRQMTRETQWVTRANFSVQSPPGAGHFV